MEILFLGTSSGVPTKERNVSGTALKIPDSKDWVLVDCGEGTQHQILRSPLSLITLKAIFITHVHGDHCYGLPGLLASAGMAGRTESLTIVAPKNVETFFNVIKDTTQLYLPYDVSFIETEKLKDYSIGQMHVDPCLLSHRVVSHGFVFTMKSSHRKLMPSKLIEAGIPKGPLWGEIQRGGEVYDEKGRRIETNAFIEQDENQKKVIIAGDNDRPECFSEVAKEADVLVHESTYTEAILQQVGEGPQHSSALRVAKFAEAMNVKNLVLTHFSARFQNDPIASSPISAIREEAEKEYSGTLFLANDFDCYVLNRDGELILRKE